MTQVAKVSLLDAPGSILSLYHPRPSVSELSTLSHDVSGTVSHCFTCLSVCRGVSQTVPTLLSAGGARKEPRSEGEDVDPTSAASGRTFPVSTPRWFWLLLAPARLPGGALAYQHVSLLSSPTPGLSRQKPWTRVFIL